MTSKALYYSSKSNFSNRHKVVPQFEKRACEVFPFFTALYFTTPSKYVRLHSFLDLKDIDILTLLRGSSSLKSSKKLKTQQIS